MMLSVLNWKPDAEEIATVFLATFAALARKVANITNIAVASI